MKNDLNELKFNKELQKKAYYDQLSMLYLHNTCLKTMIDSSDKDNLSKYDLTHIMKEITTILENTMQHAYKNIFNIDVRELEQIQDMVLMEESLNRYKLILNKLERE